MFIVLGRWRKYDSVVSLCVCVSLCVYAQKETN